MVFTIQITHPMPPVMIQIDKIRGKLKILMCNWNTMSFITHPLQTELVKKKVLICFFAKWD